MQHGNSATAIIVVVVVIVIVGGFLGYSYFKSQPSSYLGPHLSLEYVSPYGNNTFTSGQSFQVTLTLVNITSVNTNPYSQTYLSGYSVCLYDGSQQISCGVTGSNGEAILTVTAGSPGTTMVLNGVATIGNSKVTSYVYSVHIN